MSIPGKRKCANCRYLSDAGLAGNGWCTHPKRQVSSDVRILVRKGELACRNSWGGDLWEAGNGSASANGSSRSELMPFEASIPTPRFDDQVTSVVNTDSNATRANGVAGFNGAEGRVVAPPDDQVVAHGTIVPDEREPRRARPERRTLEEVNHLAHADQHERANVMARGGPREAILRARERHRQRNGFLVRADEAPLREDTMSGQDDIVEATKPVAPDSDQPAPPQTNVEAPRPPQDRLIDTRQRRAPASGIDPFHRSYNDPAPPVPTSELPAGAEALSDRNGARSRFDSVPEVRPDIVLPRRQPPTSPTRRRAEAARQRHRAQEVGPSQGPTSELDTAGSRPYDRAASQNRNIRAAAKATRDNRPNRQAPRLSSPRPSAEVSAVDDDVVSSRPTAGPSPLPDEVEIQASRPAVEDAPERTPTSRADERNSAEREQSPASIDAVHVQSDTEVHQGFTALDSAFGDPPVQPHLPPELIEEPVTVRRRSWLTGLGRRRQDAPAAAAPPVATFPLHFSADHRSIEEVSDAHSDDSPAFSPLSGEPKTPRPQRDPEPEVPEREAQAPGARQATTAPANMAEATRPAPSLVDQPVVRETPPAPIEHLRPMPSHRRAAPQQADEEYDMAELRKRLFGVSSTADTGPTTAPRGVDRQAAADVRQELPPPPPTLPNVEEVQAPIQAVEEFPDIDPSAGLDEFPTKVEAAPGFDLRRIVDRQRDLLDMRVKLAPEVPRVCRTCRSFRPAENEERGWCTNEWAFTHRRMVNAGDRPCQSSIGCWWLPDDGIWLADDALAAFDAATPLMDAILARFERRRVGER